MCSAIADIADLPIASATDDPVEHFLEAFCPRCERVVNPVCPVCKHMVEAAGAGPDGKAEVQSPESKVQGPFRPHPGPLPRGEGVGSGPSHSALSPALSPGERERNATGAGQSSLTRSEFYRRFLQLLQGARNSKFTLGCYLISTGDAFAEGVSMAEFAKEWGVRRATVSKQCHLICAALGLPPSRYMRDEATCAKFRLSNRRPRKL